MSFASVRIGVVPLPSETTAAALVLVAGVAAMYLPVYWNAAHSLWQQDEHAHAPLVLAVCIWLAWSRRRALQITPTAAAPLWAWPLLLFGLSIYLIGRLVGISVLEFGSQPLVLAAGILLLRGPHVLRIAWFAVFFTIFMVPVPAVLVDALTGPLKQLISMLVEEILFAAGYPIGRSGVTISVGQYQLLVADACSGLNSMISLLALGTLFIYILARPGHLHNAVMLAAILPIAFAANIVRVIALILITYHLGDEAGQGFLHDLAGVVLMVAALLGFFLLDCLLNFYIPRHRNRSLRLAAGI